MCSATEFHWLHKVVFYYRTNLSKKKISSNGNNIDNNVERQDIPHIEIKTPIFRISFHTSSLMETLSSCNELLNR